MAAYRRVKLCELNSDVSNSMVVGIIIAKWPTRIFKSRRSPEEARGVWSFTLRDSPRDFINCTTWGSPHFVTTLDQAYHVGDVVDILGPRIKTRQLDDRSEQYIPQLIINEKQSEISIHETDNFMEFLPLMHIPTKPSVGYFRLADILTIRDVKDDFIDILVAVRVVTPIKMIKTKLGEEIPTRDLFVMDQSTPSHFQIALWDIESINRSSLWQPRETVLFISDVKIEWNNYTKSLVGRITGRSVITEDPHTPEAESLRVYARHVSFKKNTILNKISANIPDLNSIKTVMSVQQVLDRSNNDDFDQFTALMFVTVTRIDLDGPGRFIVTQCGCCGSILQNSKSVCDNVECSMATGTEKFESEMNFDIRMTLTDHTGSLNNCRLAGKFAQDVLGCDVNEFAQMGIDARGELKWKILLERCTVKISVIKGPVVSVLSCVIGDPNEIVNKLPVY